MGKKRIIIIAIILLLFIGLGTFVFANPSEDLEGDINSNNVTNNTINGTGDEPVILENPTDDADAPAAAIIPNPVNQIVNTPNAYNAALAALQRAENSLALGDADIASSLISALVASDNKTILEVRLNNLLNTIELRDLVQRAVSLLDSSTSLEDINALRTFISDNDIVARVENLIYTDVKNELTANVEKIVKITSDESAPIIANYAEGYLNNTSNITIEDDNDFVILVNDEEVTLNELQSINGDGLYKITVIDSAYNENTIVIRIDNTAPVIEIEQGAQYNIGFIPSIVDASLSSITLNGEYYSLGSSIDNPGLYNLKATDRVGNESEVTFIVGKVPIRIEVTVPEDLVYDKTAKEITYKIYNVYTNEEVDVPATVTYADPVNAGVSDVLVAYNGDDYYEENSVTVQMSIAKADTSIRLTAPESFVYNTEEIKYQADVLDTLGNVIDEAVITYYDAIGNIVSPVDAGDYQVVATYAGNENYNAAETITENFTVTQARTRISLVAPENLVYNGQDKDYIAVVEAEYNGKWTKITEMNAIYDDVNGTRISSIRNAGTYSVKGYYGGNKNLKASYKAQEITIEKAETEIRFAEDSFTYDGEEKIVTPTIYIKGTRTVAFGPSAINDLSYTGDRINAGFFTVSASYEGNLNYLPCEVTKEFVINPMELSPVDDATFDEAVNNASHNIIIKLQNDLTVSGFNGSKIKSSYLMVDLNNHVLSFTNPNEYLIIQNGQEVSFKNGTINLYTGNVGYEAISARSGSKLNLDNVNIMTDGTTIFPRGTAEVNINNSTLTSTGYVIATNAKTADYWYPNVKVTNSNITSTNYTAIIFNVPGNLNILNSNISGPAQGIFLRGGNAVITNSTITNPNQNSDKLYNYHNQNWGEGNQAPFAALTIGNRSSSYQYPTNVVLNNTTLISNLYPTLYAYANETEGIGVYINGVSLDDPNAIYASRNIFINGEEYILDAE